MTPVLGKGLGALIKGAGLIDHDERDGPASAARPQKAPEAAAREGAGPQSDLAAERDALRAKIKELEDEKRQLMKAMDVMTKDIRSQLKDEMEAALGDERKRIEAQTQERLTQAREAHDRELADRLAEAELRMKGELDSLVEATEAQSSAEREADIAKRMDAERKRLEAEMERKAAREREALEREYESKLRDIERQGKQAMQERKSEIAREFDQRVVVQCAKADLNKRNIRDSIAKKEIFFTAEQERKMGRPDEAIRAINTGLEKYPSDWEMEHHKATLLLNMGHPRLAMAWCRRSLIKNDQNPKGWYTFGLILERLGKAKDASECFDFTLRLDPSHRDAAMRRSK